MASFLYKFIPNFVDPHIFTQCRVLFLPGYNSFAAVAHVMAIFGHEDVHGNTSQYYHQLIGRKQEEEIENLKFNFTFATSVGAGSHVPSN